MNATDVLSEVSRLAKPLLSDELWQRIEPLLPPLRPHPKGGRPWTGNREALTGILFILRTGIPWEYLPQEMGCGCGMTCWRRLRDWQAAGVWQRLHELLLAELNGADKIDWSRAVVDSAMLRAMCGGPKTGPNPTDRRKPGSKHHVLTDAWGVPLVLLLTAANVHDVKELLPLVDHIPPVRGKPGPPRREGKLANKNEVIAELMQEHVQLKKNLGTSEGAVGPPRHPQSS